jgi:YbgC/YbaW family acyl-CoA thioester hydrolase
MAEPFRTTRRVEFADTDMAGIAHFSNFFRWMESAEVEFLRTRGLSVALPWEGQKLGFPRVAAACDYLKPVRFEDLLDVTVRVERVGARSVTYAFDFSKGGEPVARGRVTSVCCRVRAGHEIESIDIPEGIREKLLAV